MEILSESPGYFLFDGFGHICADIHEIVGCPKKQKPQDQDLSRFYIGSDKRCNAENRRVSVDFQSSVSLYAFSPFLCGNNLAVPPKAPFRI